MTPRFPANPVEMLTSIWRHRSLVRAAANREVLTRYRGSAMGILWSFFTPLLMLAVYTFVFGEIFKARWSSGSDSKVEFALVLFAGLIVFGLYSDCVNRAPGLVLANVNYVKKVVFPLEILPWVNLTSALFHGAVSVCVWLVAYSVFYGAPHPTVLYLPLVLAPFVLFIAGLSWMLASLGVYLRDVSQFIGVLTTAMMFLSPIFYPATAVPVGYRHLLYLNPLTPVVEQTRDVLFWGKAPDFQMLALYWAVSAIVAWLGFAWFQKTRKGFADVL